MPTVWVLQVVLTPRGSPPVAQDRYRSSPRSSCHPVIPSSLCEEPGRQGMPTPSDGPPGHVRAAVTSI